MNQSLLLVLAFASLCALLHAQGYDDGTMALQKRKSAYMRFGKRSSLGDETDFYDDAQLVNKRKSAYLRFGKRSAGEVPDFFEIEETPAMIKRKSAYMRFGKRSAEPFGDDEAMLMDKRKPASIRFG